MILKQFEASPLSLGCPPCARSDFSWDLVLFCQKSLSCKEACKKKTFLFKFPFHSLRDHLAQSSFTRLPKVLLMCLTEETLPWAVHLWSADKTPGWDRQLLWLLEHPLCWSESPNQRLAFNPFPPSLRYLQSHAHTFVTSWHPFPLPSVPGKIVRVVAIFFIRPLMLFFVWSCVRTCSRLSLPRDYRSPFGVKTDKDF